jgi:hypothetical protein
MEAAANYITTEKNGERAATRTIRSGIEDGLECPHDDLPNTDEPADANLALVEGKSSEPSKKNEKPVEWHNTELFDPWAQYYVPEFPLDVLPHDVQEFVVAQGESIGCGASAMAMNVPSWMRSTARLMGFLSLIQHLERPER